MKHELPNTNQIKTMLKKQLELNDFCDDTVLFWEGYLCALLQFSLIKGDHELYTLLPQVGNQESHDFWLGGPLDKKSD